MLAVAIDKRIFTSIAGTSVATVVTVVLVLHWQRLAHQHEQEMIRRFEAISRMNDRIRNALQAIACVSYARAPAQDIRQALDVIDYELRGVVSDAHPATPQPATSVTTRAHRAG